MKHNAAWAEAYLCTKWHLDPSSRLATTKHGPKIGGCAPFLGRGAGSPSSTNVACLKAYLHAKWHLDLSSHLGTIDMGQKLGALPPFWGRGAGSPSDTMSLGSRSSSIRSGILIHPSSCLGTTDMGEN